MLFTVCCDFWNVTPMLNEDLLYYMWTQSVPLK